MQHIDKIEKFFEFLEEHLESGFAKKKREYSLSYYDEYSDETDEIKDEFIYASTEGRNENNNVDEVIYTDVIYINPVKKIKRIYSIKEGSGKEILKEVSLYKELRNLYRTKFRVFYNNLLDFNKTETKNFEFPSEFSIHLDIILKKIKFFKEKAEDVRLYIYNSKGESILLLHSYLEILIKKIKIYFDVPSCEITSKKDETFSLSTKNDKKKSKQFHDYFSCENPIALAEKLKSKFQTEKGKKIKILIDILVEKKKIEILPREYKNFYNKMKEYFGRDIGSYNSIQNVKDYDSIDKTSICQLVDNILVNV